MAAEHLERISCEKFRAALAHIVANGDAIMFGATSDGGALVITIMEGAERHKLYCTSPEELDAALDAMLA